VKIIEKFYCCDFIDSLIFLLMQWKLFYEKKTFILNEQFYSILNKKISNYSSYIHKSLILSYIESNKLHQNIMYSIFFYLHIYALNDQSIDNT